MTMMTMKGHKLQRAAVDVGRADNRHPRVTGLVTFERAQDEWLREVQEEYRHGKLSASTELQDITAEAVLWEARAEATQPERNADLRPCLAEEQLEDTARRSRERIASTRKNGRKPSLQKFGVWLRRRGGRPATLLRSLDGRPHS